MSRSSIATTGTSASRRIASLFVALAIACATLAGVGLRPERADAIVPEFLPAITVAGGNGAGDAANQLAYPSGVAVDGDGNIYVADSNNHRVQLWAPGATEGVTVAGANGAGSAANQFASPCEVAIDGDGNIYVADSGNHRVQRWAPGATEGVTVAGGNGAGSGANQLFYPCGLAVDGDGNVYVGDGENSRVQLWAPGATEGVTVAGGNGAGSAANQLCYAYRVAVDADGNVYVTDQCNPRVQRWAPGATEGVTVAGGNGFGFAANQVSAAAGVAVDGAGNVYVGDNAYTDTDDNPRVQVWAPGATEGVTVAGGNGFGSAANQLKAVAGVAVDGEGNVYVVDFANHRVQEVEKIGSLSAVVPARLADTRPGGITTDGLWAGTGILAGGSTLEFVVGGRGGVPADASAAMLNVTAVTPFAAGYLTVYPCGSARPNASNVNYVTGDVVPNAVFAKLGTVGKVCIFSNAATHVVVDVNGYVPAVSTVAAVVPARLADTRSGGITTDGLGAGTGILAGGSTLEVVVGGRGGVPADASAAMLNVTAVTPSVPGYLTVYPCGSARPNASNVNYVTGDVVPNAVFAKLGTDGKVCIFSNAATQVVVDVNGYVPAVSAMAAVVPARLADTRSGGITTDGLGAGTGILAGGSTLEVVVGGRGGVPADASAAMLNVTAVTPSVPGYLTVYPCGSARPNASNVNYVTGDVVPNAVFAKLGTDGKVCIFSNAATHVVVDVSGYVPAGG